MWRSRKVEYGDKNGKATMTAFMTIVLTKQGGQWAMTADHDSLAAPVSHAERAHKERGGIVLAQPEMER
jgi:hypothetical protein